MQSARAPLRGIPPCGRRSHIRASPRSPGGGARRSKGTRRETFRTVQELGTSIVHIDERYAMLEQTLRAVEELRWECERAGDADLDDVERSVDTLDGRGRTRARACGERNALRSKFEQRRVPILIGRSPSENADLTFHVARPHDLWFHAQNIPGARDSAARRPRGTAGWGYCAGRIACGVLFQGQGERQSSDRLYRAKTRPRTARRDGGAGVVTNPRTVIAEPRE